METLLTLSNRGRHCIIYNGCKHRLIRKNLTGEEVWRCCNKYCPVNLKTIDRIIVKETGKHCHEIIKAAVVKQALKVTKRRSNRIVKDKNKCEPNVPLNIGVEIIENEKNESDNKDGTISSYKHLIDEHDIIDKSPSSKNKKLNEQSNKESEDNFAKFMSLEMRKVKPELLDDLKFEIHSLIYEAIKKSK